MQQESQAICKPSEPSNLATVVWFQRRACLKQWMNAKHGGDVPIVENKADKYFNIYADWVIKLSNL